MENWDDYRLILSLHRGKTLRNAAQFLALNHSTVSRRLATLNHKYGTQVFESTAKGYDLTPLGSKLLSTALKIESFAIEGKRLEHAQSIDVSGRINLSIPPAIGQYLLLDELSEFQKQYPQVSLNIQTSYLLADLDNCESDVVVRVSNKPSEHLVGHRLFPIALSYYASKSYLKNNQVSDYKWITNTTDESRASWIAQSPFPLADISLKVEDLVLRHYAAAQGHGMIMGACYIADNMNELTRINQDYTFPHQDIWVLTHPDLRHVPRIKALVAYLVKVLRDKHTLIRGQTPFIQPQCK